MTFRYVALLGLTTLTTVGAALPGSMGIEQLPMPVQSWAGSARSGGSRVLHLARDDFASLPGSVASSFQAPGSSASSGFTISNWGKPQHTRLSIVQEDGREIDLPQSKYLAAVVLGCLSICGLFAVRAWFGSAI